MLQLFDRRVLLVAGKGGVGRTTLTAALARVAARSGKRVLVAEIEEPSRQGASRLAQIFGTELFGPSPRRLEDNTWGVALQARAGTEAFLTSLFRVPALSRLALRTPALIRLLEAGPSFHEMGIFNHFLSLVDALRPNGQPRFDLLLLDMPATGHALALTGLPDILLRLVPTGPIAKRLRAGQALMSNPRRALGVVVTLPEPLPVSESEELAAGLEDTGVQVGAVLANRVPTDPFTPDERAALAQLDLGPDTLGWAATQRAERAEASLTRLRGHFSAPVIEVPEVLEEDPMPQIVSALAKVAR